MLCFSASRCRGYLHAKSLGSCGEFLSYISLQMSHARLETYAERQQRVQLRLPKEARQHIVRVKGMKKEIHKAAWIMIERMQRAAGASAEVQVVIS
jgi:phage tail tape-measure protein